MTVTADAAFWDGVQGNETLWVAVHADDGDGTFEPGTDTIAAFKGSNATARVPVRAVEQGRTYVLGGGRNQKTPTAEVYVPRVALAEDGFVVLRSEGESESRIVGYTAVENGTHRRLQVPIDDSFFASLDDWTTLQVVVYGDDGDGEFTSRDTPVKVDGKRVAAEFTFEKVDGTPVTPTLEASPSPSGANGSTPTPTPRLVTTPSSTNTPTDTPTAATTTSTPGFTILAGVTVLAGIVAVVWTIRRGD